MAVDAGGRKIGGVTRQSMLQCAWLCVELVEQCKYVCVVFLLSHHANHGHIKRYTFGRICTVQPDNVAVKGKKSVGNGGTLMTNKGEERGERRETRTRKRREERRTGQ